MGSRPHSKDKKFIMNTALEFARTMRVVHASSYLFLFLLT